FELRLDANPLAGGGRSGRLVLLSLRRSRLRLRRRHNRFGLRGLSLTLHVHAAAEMRTLGDRDSRRDDVAVHGYVVADVDFVARRPGVTVGTGACGAASVGGLPAGRTASSRFHTVIPPLSSSQGARGAYVRARSENLSSIWDPFERCLVLSLPMVSGRCYNAS